MNGHVGACNNSNDQQTIQKLHMQKHPKKSKQKTLKKPCTAAKLLTALFFLSSLKSEI